MKSFGGIMLFICSVVTTKIQISRCWSNNYHSLSRIANSHTIQRRRILSSPFSSTTTTSRKASTSDTTTIDTKMVPTPSEKKVLRGVVFDMDGTLTIPSLDFVEMYKRCGIDIKDDIIRVLNSLPADEAKAKWDIIHEMEDEAVTNMQSMPGAIEVLTWLQQHAIPTAIVTRNTYKSAVALQSNLNCTFSYIIARDNDDHPPKPDPSALLYIAQQWGIDKKDDLPSIIMVGDNLENDIGFGQAAGTTTALVDYYKERQQHQIDASPYRPDIAIHNLYDLPRRLFHHYIIDGPLGTNVPLLKYDTPEPSHPVTIAAANGNVDVLRQLLNEHGTETVIVDDTGNTPLIWAVDRGHVSIVDYLLSNGHGQEHIVNTRGYLGATAVCRAARRGYVDILHRLCDAGANLDIPNNKLQYPLHFAAFKENMNIVQLLLQRGCNTRVLDRKGRIPAEDTKNEEIRDYILSHM